MRINTLLLLLLLSISLSYEAAAMDIPPATQKAPILRLQGNSLGRIKIQRTQTGHSPKKDAPVIIGYQSPLIKRLKVASTLGNKDSGPIVGQGIDYSKDNHTYVGALSRRTSFAVNANQISWDMLARSFLDEFECLEVLSSPLEVEDFEDFLINLAHFVKEHIAEIQTLATYDLNKGKQVCRHFSTYTAVLFFKIKKIIEETTECDWPATIDVAKAGRFGYEWEMMGGHAWNFVTYRNNTVLHRFHYDVLNLILVRIDENKRAEHHEALDFKDNLDPQYFNITERSVFGWFKYTVNRYVYGDDKDSIYNAENSEMMAIIVDKILSVKRPDRVTARTVLIEKKTLKRRRDDSADKHPKVRRKLF